MDASVTDHPLIAVVDDDVGTRQLFADLLDEEPVSVVLWSGQDDPVSFVRESRANLVILDLHLGGRFHAWDVIAALCGDGSRVQVPVLICSADGLVIQRDGPAFQDRGCLIIEKPFDVQTLLDAIHAALTPPWRPTGATDQASRTA